MSYDADVWRPPRTTMPPRATGRRAGARLMAATKDGRRDQDAILARRRVASGLDRSPGVSGKLWRRHWRYIVIGIVLVVCYGIALWQTYVTVAGSLREEIAKMGEEATGQPIEIGWGQINEAVLVSARYAGYTFLVLFAILVCIDRLRPTPWGMKLAAVGWGGSIAIFISLHINTWAGGLMQVQGSVDVTDGSRTAIFSAPVVEEAAKATILFWLAIALRRRIVSAHQSVVLAALSGIGFAFVENIVYYLRVYVYASNIYQTDADEELSKIVVLRGLMTCFGHPMFTSMTALGLIVGLMSRSKFVRILAPVTGYLGAVLGHMLFNGFASVSDSSTLLAIIGWVCVVVLAVFLGFRFVHQVRNVRARLSELVAMGWLEPDDPAVFTRIRSRGRMLLAGAFRGRKVWLATWRLQRWMTELAYARDAELRGIIDAMGIVRQRELIIAINETREIAVDRAAGVPLIPPSWGQWWRRMRHDLAARMRGRAPASLPAPRERVRV